MIRKYFFILLSYFLSPLCFITLFTSLVLAETQLTITIGNGYGLPGSVSSPVEVSLGNDVPVRGVQFVFCNEDDFLTLNEIRTTERTEGFLVQFNQDNGIVLLVSLSGNTIVPGSGPILELLFDVSEEAPEGECRNLYLQNVKIVAKTSPLNSNNSNVFNWHSSKENKSPMSESALFCFTESMPTTTTTTIITTTTTTTYCPISYIYDDEHSEEAELLRYFRDNLLNQTPEGQELIKLYYELSPTIVKAMEEDEEFKEQVKEMIDEVLELIEGE